MERELSVPTKHEELAAIRTANPELEHVDAKFLIAPDENLSDFDLEIPSDSAPYSLALARIGIARFELEDRLPTPVTADGLVDVPALIEQLKALAPDHDWEAPFFDAHHLYCPFCIYEYEMDESKFLEGLEYTDEEREKVETMSEFHQHPSNIIAIPRVAHDAIHAAFIPVDRPAFEVMRRENKVRRRKKYLYKVANDAITIHESLDRIERKQDSRGNVMWIDRKRKRTYQGEDAPDRLEERFKRYVNQILVHAQKGLIDLSELSPVEMVDEAVLAQNLRGAAEILEDGLVAIRNRKALDVQLPIRTIERSSYKKGKLLPQAA